MGMKESMMNNMMDKMSKEEKQEMMSGMMENFFSDMTEEDKSEMMSNMMGNMFKDGPPPMMGMMKMMMGGKGGEGKSPMMDMCKSMMGQMRESKVIAGYATAELRGLFEEWIIQLESEIMESITKKGSINPEDLSAEFHLQSESIKFILNRLAEKGKINYTL